MNYALEIIQTVNRHCSNIELTDVADFIDGEKHRINIGVMGTVVAAKCQDLRWLIYQSLEKHKFAYVRENKSRIIEEVDREWKNIFVRFKSITLDAHAAAEAYAFELNNACVFHSMMVLEKGLAALADAVGETAKREAWGKLIERIEKAVLKQIAATKTPPPGTKSLSPRAAAARLAKLEIYAAAAKEFTYFRLAWRNHVAHGRANYDEDDALRVFSHVRDFMASISQCLKERK